MSETTAPAISPATWATINTVAATAESLISIMLAGRLTGINTSVQGEVQVIGADANAIIDEVKAALDKQETSNPAVATLLEGVVNTVKNLGIQIPQEDALFAALHQVVTDLQGALVPAAPAA